MGELRLKQEGIDDVYIVSFITISLLFIFHYLSNRASVTVWIHLEGSISSMRATVLLQMVCNVVD